MTIKELQKCYNNLVDSNSGKYATIEEVNQAVSSVGDISLTLGIPKVLGGLVSVVNNSFKRNFSAKSNEAFQQYLNNDNKHVLPCFDGIYNSLIKLVQENEDLEISSIVKDILKLKSGEEVKLFNYDYKVFEVDTSI